MLFPKDRKAFFYIKIPLFLYAALMFCFSSIPGDRLDFLKDISDYLLHSVEYAIFAWLLIRALHLKWDDGGKVYPLAVLISAVYGALDEAHQFFVPGRYADVRDVIADFIGAVVLVGIYIFTKRYKKDGSAVD